MRRSELERGKQTARTCFVASNFVIHEFYLWGKYEQAFGYNLPDCMKQGERSGYFASIFDFLFIVACIPK